MAGGFHLRVGLDPEHRGAQMGQPDSPTLTELDLHHLMPFGGVAELAARYHRLVIQALNFVV